MAKYFSHILIERGGLGDRQIKGVDMVGLCAHHSLMRVCGFESTITAVSKKKSALVPKIGANAQVTWRVENTKNQKMS